MDVGDFVRRCMDADDPSTAEFRQAVAELREAADGFTRCPHCGNRWAEAA